MIIAVVTGNDGQRYYYGPFANALDAIAWGEKYAKGFEVKWAEVHNVQEFGSAMEDDD